MSISKTVSKKDKTDLLRGTLDLLVLRTLELQPLHGVGVDWAWAVNAVAWLVIFAGGAVWRFRKDTARV